MGAELDATDWRILRELQADGRITNVALAARVGLSPPPCLRRVRALEQAGFIRGYHAELDARLAGYEITAFASVRLHAQGESDLRDFERQVFEQPANDRDLLGVRGGETALARIEAVFQPDPDVAAHDRADRAQAQLVPAGAGIG